MTQYCHLPLQVTIVSYAGNLIHQKFLSDITYYSWRENVQISSLPSKNAIKDNPIPPQRILTSELALNREQKASEAQLSPKRFNLLLETQHPTNLK